eukprot:CAMPEP_0178668346 /NCGR_PEP_ID=MMETSP0698-20121128/31532_1 /TAXON_ID=265572 /ORGANISM="Extubocellulus spinifer, Strain CCMP396" /LENGTH=1021 /DNA_ID=CAMNT_0020311909 /DNA_START=302 /DNA_END=3368 /DNA_ORIENTATION=+
MKSTRRSPEFVGSSSGLLPLLLLLLCSTITTYAFSLGGWSHITRTSSTLSASSKAAVVQNGSSSLRVHFPGLLHRRTTSHFASSSSASAASGRPTSRGGMSMVIDRLSKECIGSIMVAQSESKALGLSELGNAMITLGVVSKPERADRTLTKFNILPKNVKASAIKVATGALPTAVASDDAAVAGATANVGDNLKDDDNALPFSEEAKATLSRAGTIADRFASKTIRSEHLLLALLEYNVEDAGSAASRETGPAPGGGDSPSCKALSVILNADGVDADSFDAFTFCDALLDDLLEQGPVQEEVGGIDTQNSEDVVTQREVVVIGGSSGNTPTLDDVGIDLTLMALEGKIDAVYGRNDEVRMCLRTLGRRRKNNPCLIGDPGVGKTAIAEAIAQVIASSYPTAGESKTDKKARKWLRNPFGGEDDKGKDEKLNGDGVDEATNPLIDLDLPPCPKSLEGYRVISVELASLVAGTANRGDFEKRVQSLVREAGNSKTILFIDEVHTLLGTGGGDGGLNAANLLKPALARGELQVIGATTTPEYRTYIEKDGALERRFQPLNVKEPTIEETLDILEAVRPRYEEYHGVEYTAKAMEAAAKLSDRYLNDRFLPDKAIDLLDESGSMIKMDVFDEEEDDVVVTEDTVAEVISEISGIPIGRLDTGEKERLRNLEEDMGDRIKGQERAVRSVAKSIRRARSGLRDGRRPIASFLFCGPTGVGKTEVCKSLAETYYGREKDMIRIDMSEYMERFSTSRLIGSPPGYVGYDEGGQLTNAVRRTPHSVVLLDEIEKAHEDVLNILLQIMDEGQLTDGKGRTVSFKNCIFIMTSNVGSQRILDMSKVKAGVLEMANTVKEELEKSMKPELLNRIDEIVIFSPLSYKNLRAIASNILDETVGRAREEQEMDLTVTDDLVEKVTEEGCMDANQYGARPIRRAAQRFLENTLSEAVMQDFVHEGDQVTVDVATKDEADGFDGDQVVVKVIKSSTGESMLIQVEDDAGLGSVEFQSPEDEALNRDMPPLPEEGAFE